MPDDVTNLVINTATAPPQDLMKFLTIVIGQMGSAMIERKATRAGTDRESVDAAYAEELDRIVSLTKDLSKQLGLSTSVYDYELGTVVLSVLQLAVWEMQKFIQTCESLTEAVSNEEAEAQDDVEEPAEATQQADTVGVMDVEPLAQEDEQFHKAQSPFGGKTLVLRKATHDH